MNRSLFIMTFLATGCSTSAPLIRVAAPPVVVAEPPRIEAVMDLGALPLPPAGPLDDAHQDMRFTPGEWMVIRGFGLGGGQVAVDERPLEIEGYLEDGSLLVRWPTGLLARDDHMLTVETNAGVASHRVASAFYLVGSDPKGGEIHFLRTAPNEKKLIDESRNTIDKKGAFFHAHSTDGGLLYALAPHKKRKTTGRVDFESILTVIHLGAKDAPEVVAETVVTTVGPPTAFAVNERYAVVLGAEALDILSLANPLAPQSESRLPLPKVTKKTRYTTVGFTGPSEVAVLNATENQVQWVQLDGSKLGAMQDVGPSKVAASIDMIAFSGRVWVLQGQSLRGASKNSGPLSRT